MKALVYISEKKLEFKEIPYPEGDIIIKVLASGICGTDLKTYLHGHPMFKPPVILGHECYGKIVKINKKIDGINIGDLVVVAPYIECGSCSICKEGIPELCKNKTYLESGCFCEYISISIDHAKKGLFKIEKDEKKYILTEPLACVLNGIEKLKRIGKILVVGGGTMGALFAITLSKMEGSVKVVEVSSWKLEFLKNLGIEAVPPEELEDEEFDSIILAVNIPELPKKYISKIKDGGSMLLFAGYPLNSILEIDPYYIHYREVSIIGSFGYTSSQFVKALSWIRKHEEYSSLITHEFPLEEGPKAFSLLESGKAMKIILRIRENETV